MKRGNKNEKKVFIIKNHMIGLIDCDWPILLVTFQTIY